MLPVDDLLKVLKCDFLYIPHEFERFRLAKDCLLRLLPSNVTKYKIIGSTIPSYVKKVSNFYEEPTPEWLASSNNNEFVVKFRAFFQDSVSYQDMSFSQLDDIIKIMNKGLV